MKVKIKSDGTVQGTTVTNKETGEAIEGVIYVGWKIDADTDLNTCHLILQGSEVEVEAEYPVVHKAPPARYIMED